MAGTLCIGDKGDQVLELQKDLEQLGYGSYLISGKNGLFDANTQKAVAAFQAAKGIKEVAGGVTFESLKVGDKVTFLGGKVYVSSDATKAASTRGKSETKCYHLAKQNAHPISLISEDNVGVYGWVDKADCDLSGGAICGPLTWEKIRAAISPDPPIVKTETVKTTKESYRQTAPVIPIVSSDSSIFILNLVTGTQINLVTRPEEVTDSITANFEFESPRGRSMAYVGYQSTENKTVSFTIPLHVDLVKESSLDACVNKLKALEYPNYSGGQVIPPNCYVNMFRGLRFSAVCTSCDVTWKGDIKNGGYTHADVSMTFRGVSEVPFSATQVESGGNNNG